MTSLDQNIDRIEIMSHCTYIHVTCVVSNKKYKFIYSHSRLAIVGVYPTNCPRDCYREFKRYYEDLVLTNRKQEEEEFDEFVLQSDSFIGAYRRLRNKLLNFLDRI